MKPIFRIAGIALLGLAAGPALAGKGGPPPTPTFTTVVIGQDKVGDDEFFAGINWQFGAHSQAEIVIGYRDVNVHSDGDVDGAGIDFTFPIKDGLKFGEMRLKGINGQDDWQGEFGLGWSFLHQGFLLTGGAQGNFVTLGTDYVFGSTMGVATAADAQSRNDRQDRREQRDDRRDNREDRREFRQDQREDRREYRQDQRQYARWQQSQRRYNASRYVAPRGYAVRQWSYGQRMPVLLSRQPLRRQRLRPLWPACAAPWLPLRPQRQ